jgi:DNA transformation protein and related proteins
VSASQGSAPGGYLAYALEQLEAVPQLRWRRMFGGVGIYSGDLMFALIGADMLYCKADESNRADYEARGKGPFLPFPDKPNLVMAYYEVPADVIEDRDELTLWARKAIAAALAARLAKSSRKAKPLRKAKLVSRPKQAGKAQQVHKTKQLRRANRSRNAR